PKGVLGVIRSVEMRPRENERLLVRAFSLFGLIGTPRESNTQNSLRLCAVRPVHTTHNVEECPGSSGIHCLKRRSANV
ncbi:MAG: hypothetical protein LBM69_02820, partial [Lachnospiraceae bacterium]|nr:hypothetical protein [Lachnospiraceae bacterium]